MSIQKIARLAKRLGGHGVAGAEQQRYGKSQKP